MKVCITECIHVHIMAQNDPNIAITQSQQYLEQNEDIIAAVVENLQLGRLDDCMKHYETLQ